VTLQEAYCLNTIRARLRAALTTEAQLTRFRERVIDLICDIADDGLAPDPAEMVADTLPAPVSPELASELAIDVEVEECAPSVPAESLAAQEYAP
jgi:hypothetical protein